jgi:flagellar biosynthesis protein FlhG
MMTGQAPGVFAICSGKGGVGKTNVAVNLAVAMAERGHDTMLLDADVCLANVDVLLGLQPRFNLADVLSGDADLDATVLAGPRGLRIVPATSGNFDLTGLSGIEQAALVNAFAGLSDQPDMLVVDTAAGISPTVARFVAAAQQAFVVVCDEPASLTDAYALIKVFSQHYGIRRFNVVTNQSPGRRAGTRLFDKLARVTDRYLDVVLRHAGDIPADRLLQKAVQEQRAVVDAYPDTAASEAFRALARYVECLPRAGGASGGIEFFLERLVMSRSIEEEAVA